MVPEAAPHGRGPAEVALVVGEQTISGLIEGAPVLDAAQDVFDLFSRAIDVVDVLGRDDGDAVVRGGAERDLGGETLLGEQVVLHLDEQRVAEDVPIGCEQAHGLLDAARGRERPLEERGERHEPRGALSEFLGRGVRADRAVARSGPW